ncbi:tolloid-like protein 2 isoform X1 [Daphnia pulicaria]|uniref:tolloid-like protein 2 isoform X1 n=1 Tax=Daphnia pulicaria TaxID=35523 RepID=UPI001EEBFF0A|nr:tolloid-like protein 2 isoform X1 [Daphnia pulicaria]
MAWFRFWLVLFLIVFVKSELQSENNEGPKSTASAFCSAECNQQLQNRLETIEAAVRTIVSAVSSQTDDLFGPIKEIFQLDPSVRSILSLNFTTSSTIASSQNSTFKTKSVPIAQGNSQGNQQPEKSTAVDNLKGAIKCSLAHLVDINTIDFNSRLNKSSEISASLTNDSLELIWSIFSTECLKFSSGVWIRVYQQAPESGYKLQPETSLYVPQKCLKKKSKASYFIVLSPSSLKGKKMSCAFYLTRHLTPCLAYVVEIIPNFQSLRGETLRTEIIVPPNMKRSDESHFKPLISVAAQSTSLLTLNWEDNSGCAEQLTSFTLKIFQDGIVNEVERPNMTVTIPRSCLKRSTNEENLFSLVLPAKPANQLTCPIEWKPLDRCRKYTIGMNSQYSATWNGPSSSLDIFTEGLNGVVIEPTTDLSNVVWRCPKQHYYCNDYERGCVHTNYYICDGQYHCEMDENYCDQTLCVKDDGFKCGRQCVPKELVCDGKYDCLDGSDEDGCSVKCEYLTNPSGHFSSDIFPKPAVDVMHPERILAAVRKTIVLISVQRSHQIWLSFDRFTTVNNTDFLKVYDGPFSTSPLLLSHSGSKKPPSIRSSANELFLEIPSYYDTNYVVEGSYTSVNSTDEPFKPGCGGFMNAEGTFFTPNYSSDTDIVDCFWLIETRQIDDLILLQRNYSDLKHPMAALFSSRTHPEMIVYDGWSTDGLVLYDTKYSNTPIPYKKVIYSVSNKMMIHFKPPRIQENHVSYWNVSKISTPQCKNYLEGTSGTIKSPNYPKVYPNLTDCRWTISVTPGSKVRLLFAFFETQEGADFISVYDGSTINEKLLLTESGSVPTPFVVNSSTNQVLVRFTSDGDTSLSGFLAVYSSV